MNTFHAVVGMAAIAIAAVSPVPARDGQHDFDWEWGRWTTKVRVLRNPLSGESPLSA